MRSDREISVQQPELLPGGEEELAFRGLYRFVEGNPAFKARVAEDYGLLYKTLGDEVLEAQDRLPIHHWQDQDSGPEASV